MKKFLVTLFAIVLVISCSTNKKANDRLLLWYDHPASNWDEALPIGNGRLGAMVFGGIKHERLQLNESTLYSDEPGQRDVKIDITKRFDEVRQLMKEGHFDKVNKIVAHEWIGRCQPCYQPFGDIYIDFDFDPGEKAENYRRELDLSNAICKTSYQIGGVSYSREVFASFPDHVVVMFITAKQKKSINFSVRLEGAHPTAFSYIDSNTIIMKGQAPALAVRRTIKRIQKWGDQWKYPELFDKKGNPKPNTSVVMYGDKLNGRGMPYEGRLIVIPVRGQIVKKQDKLVVSKADKALLVFTGHTGFNGFDKSPSHEGVDPSIKTITDLKNVANTSYEELKKNHITDYKRLFDRMSISIGTVSEQSKMPTDKRIQLFNNGKDPALCGLFLQYARYLTIAISRPGSQPINLQGMWNDKIIPPWASGYTLNINTEMFYWPTEAANLSECTEPIHRFIRELSVSGSEVARNMYHRNGWVAHHNTTIWRSAQPVDNVCCSFWPLGAGWLCQQLWTHYRYTKDKDFLAENWPVMKGAAQFLSEWLVKTTDGFLTTPIGMSPENAYYPDKADYTTPFCEGPTMDIMIIKELFDHCIKASKILNVDEDFARRLARQKSQLRPYKIGSKGQLLEFDKEYKEVNPHHRHISHLYALMPGNEITKSSTPKLFEAARRALEIRGDGGTGWSLAWKSACWARLKDGNHAYKLINNLFVEGNSKKAGLLPNLLSSCPPFNIDANFGGADAIIEMLMQDHESIEKDGQSYPVVEILPALPDSWKKGYIKGLRAANGFILSIQWDNNEAGKIVVKSLLGEKCILRYKQRDHLIDLKKGEEKVFTFY